METSEMVNKNNGESTSVKHDALFILGNGSKHNNKEIKIAIASLIKYGSSWLNKIYVVGMDPKLKAKNLVFIHCYDKYTHSKDANIIHKIKYGIDNIPDLSEDFLVCSDDQLISHNTTWEDFTPRYFKLFDPESKYFKSFQHSLNKWKQNLYFTLMRFWEEGKTVEENDVRFYQPHIFSPINKTKFNQMCEKLGDLTGKTNIVIFSLYYNWFKPENAKENFDVLDCVGKPDKFQEVLLGRIPLPTHICYSDKAFLKPEFRAFLARVLNK